MRGSRMATMAIVACLAVVPTLADDQVAAPGITTPLLFTAGEAGQVVPGEGGAASDFDVAGGVIRAEAYTAAAESAASATSSLWSDFVVGGEGEGELAAKVFGNAGWKGAWQADGAGATATVRVFASLLELGGTEPNLVATETLLDTGVDESGCPSCFGFPSLEVNNLSVEFDRALRKGAMYRLVFQIDVEADSPADLASFVDFSGDIPQTDGAGVFLSGVGVTVEDDIDFADEFARLNEKLDSLAEQIAAAVAMAEQRFDQVDAGIALNGMKLDSLAADVATVDAKVDIVDAKVTVIDGKVDVIDGKVDAALIALENLRLATCDLERLVMTPQGRRESDLAVCEDQPGFPYDWPEPPLNGNHGNQGNGNNGNGNGNGGSSASPDDSSAQDVPTRRGRGRRF